MPQRESASVSRKRPSDRIASARRVAPPPLRPALVDHLQRTIGNRAVGRLVNNSLLTARTSARPGATHRGDALPIQRGRELNPHKQTDPSAAGSWGTTAHHIVPYTNLVNVIAKGALSEKNRNELLKAAIPDELTEAMLDNLSVELPGGNQNADAQETARASSRRGRGTGRHGE